MEILSYVIMHDSGFAPNPFGGILSLAAWGTYHPSDDEDVASIL
jgi:hypothetical protein